MSALMVLPVDLQSIVRSELKRDEEVFWVGQPDPGRFSRSALPIVLFGIPWTAFAIFWIYGASGFKSPSVSGPAGFFPLFGLPFVLIGFGMLSSPYWLKRKAKRMVYVITDRRAIIFGGGRNVKIESFGGADMSNISKVVRGDGSGDLIFASYINFSRDSDGDCNRNITKIGFIAVKNISEVSRELEDLQERCDAKKLQA